MNKYRVVPGEIFFTYKIQRRKWLLFWEDIGLSFTSSWDAEMECEILNNKAAL